MLSDRGALGKTGKADANANRARKGGAERSRPSPSGGGDSSRKSQRSSLPDEESRRLFISTGRNRRVFPRELLGFITSKTHVSRDDIGSIRILDNYSFIQVRDTVAGQIIETLDGSLFRGRPLTVNYAKPRPDTAAEYAEAAESAERSESPMDEPYTDGPEDGNDAGFQDAEASEQAEDHSDEEDI
jgi:hypothetical protein